MNSDTPLIHTTRGNLPTAALVYSVTWEDTPDATSMIETYRLDGEIVRQSKHVLTRKEMLLTTNPEPVTGG